MKKVLLIIGVVIAFLFLVVLVTRESSNQSVNPNATSQQKTSIGRTNTMDTYMQAFSQAVEGKTKVDDLPQEFFLQQQFFDPTGAMYPAITKDYLANWIVQKKIELNKYVPSPVVTWTTGECNEQFCIKIAQFGDSAYKRSIRFTFYNKLKGKDTNNIVGGLSDLLIVKWDYPNQDAAVDNVITPVNHKCDVTQSEIDQNNRIYCAANAPHDANCPYKLDSSWTQSVNAERQKTCNK